MKPNPTLDTPLYLLPFDHRHSYVSGMFHFSPPLSSQQRNAVAETKTVIYDGFLEAVRMGVPAEYAGVLVDEEFGAGILRDASAKGYTTAMPVERSGSPEFEFESGWGFVSQIEAFRPTFVKALVRYNPEGDPTLNRRQTNRLKRLSDYCRNAGQKFMFELLVPPTESQSASVGKAADYDLRLRPSLVLESMQALQDAGIEPDIWKVEGLDRREHYEQVVAAAQRDGRSHVRCIVLGRAANEEKVIEWLETAASVDGFIGFAVGRTTFWNYVQAYVAGHLTRDETVTCIARRFRDWAAIFEGGTAVSREALLAHAS